MPHSNETCIISCATTSQTGIDFDNESVIFADIILSLNNSQSLDSVFMNNNQTSNITKEASTSTKIDFDQISQTTAHLKTISIETNKTILLDQLMTTEVPNNLSSTHSNKFVIEMTELAYDNFTTELPTENKNATVGKTLSTNSIANLNISMTTQNYEMNFPNQENYSSYNYSNETESFHLKTSYVTTTYSNENSRISTQLNSTDVITTTNKPTLITSLKKISTSKKPKTSKLLPKQNDTSKGYSTTAKPKSKLKTSKPSTTVKKKNNTQKNRTLKRSFRSSNYSALNLSNSFNEYEDYYDIIADIEIIFKDSKNESLNITDYDYSFVNVTDYDDYPLEYDWYAGEYGPCSRNCGKLSELFDNKYIS